MKKYLLSVAVVVFLIPLVASQRDGSQAFSRVPLSESVVTGLNLTVASHCLSIEGVGNKHFPVHSVNINDNGYMCCGIFNGFEGKPADARLAELSACFFDNKIRGILSRDLLTFEERQAKIERLLTAFSCNILGKPETDTFIQSFLQTKTSVDDTKSVREIEQANKHAWDNGAVTVLLVLFNQAKNKAFVCQMGDNLCAVYSKDGQLLKNAPLYNFARQEERKRFEIDPSAHQSYWLSNNDAALPWPLYYLGNKKAGKGQPRGRGFKVLGFELQLGQRFFLATSAAVGSMVPSSSSSDNLSQLYNTRFPNALKEFGRCLARRDDIAEGIFTKVTNNSWSLFKAPVCVIGGRRSREDSITAQYTRYEVPCTIWRQHPWLSHPGSQYVVPVCTSTLLNRDEPRQSEDFFHHTFPSAHTGNDDQRLDLKSDCAKGFSGTFVDGKLVREKENKGNTRRQRLGGGSEEQLLTDFNASTKEPSKDSSDVQEESGKRNSQVVDIQAELAAAFAGLGESFEPITFGDGRFSSSTTDQQLGDDKWSAGAKFLN